METTIISIDHGNKQIKSEYGIKYDTGYTVMEKEPVTNKNVLKYNGEYYVIGEGRFSVMNDKTIDDKFFILSLKAIALNLKKWNKQHADIILNVGLPLIHYGELKEKYKKYFMRKDIEFEYENVHYKIDITDVFVWAQGYAAMISKFHDYKNTQLTIIDLGGYTTDLCRTTSKGLLINSSCNSIPFGIIHLINDIKKEFFQKGINLTEEQIEEIIKGEADTLFISKELYALVNKKVDTFVVNLLSKINELGYVTTINPVLFVGGGSQLLKKHIEQKTDNIGYAEFMDEFSNIYGYSILGRQALRRVI
ncbi:ParM/StbA family protein [Paramaledivibacter caminithermalis]|jgi:plasmid segregation protein ParM|uniref:Plasmid segregation protein ParM n=1 Tax=Paramaledivibacter caminithermalis (strain DSM 15212 / CIP 107654 / DViRD3) TaxID=1121301 RepID=A0A1M6M8E2_PARC5|nr:ParM/StbA family protein [Paramaledivibacter caminithermalis]SHJ79726.1 plasmid segregation protein ParM [Paramaledivibacter caminithermalis DSM 15212]